MPTLFVGGFIHWPIIKPHYLKQLECVQQDTFWVACGAPWTFGPLPWVDGSSTLQNLYSSTWHRGIHPLHLRRQSNPVCIVLVNGAGKKRREAGSQVFLSITQVLQFVLNNFIVVPIDKCFPAMPFSLSHLFFCKDTCNHPRVSLFQPTLCPGYSS